METTSNRNAAIIFGTVLIAAGVLFLFGQVFDIMDSATVWPLINIGVGLLFFVGMFLGGKNTAPLAIPGAIFTGVGLITFVQNLTGAWETWSYAWGLIVASVGLGIYIYGAYGDRPGAKEAGWSVAKVGLILFLVFGFIFEVIFSVSGISTTAGSIFFPVALAVVGLILLATRIVRLIRNPEKVSQDDRDLFWPVMFIGIGLLWTLVNLDWLSLSQAISLLSLWPVLLIVIGLDIMLGRRYPWVGALIGVVVVVGMFFYAFYGSQLGLTQRMSWARFNINIPQSRAFFTQEITGSGQIVSEQREVSNFDSIQFSAFGDVTITPGETESLLIEAEDNILPYIVTQVRSGVLVIETKPGVNFRSVGPIKYTISTKDLERLEVSGAGVVKLNGLAADNFTVNHSGAALLDLEDLQVSRFYVVLTGAGGLTATGTADRVKVDLSGAGGFKGENLRSQEVEVVISGLGSAAVWVMDRLDVEISGAGSVKYYGDPKVTKQIGGVGVVRNLGQK